MTNIIPITPGFAVARQLEPEDFARVAALGYRTIVNNRPDDEERGQLSAADARATAAEHGLAYAYIPATKHDLFTDEVVGEMANALSANDGPVLAYCKSGQRSAIAWAAATARSRPVAEILAELKDAGLDFSFLRDDLDKQADRASWANEPAKRQAVKPAEGARHAAA